VKENGRWLTLWGIRKVTHPQHEYEVTKAVLCFLPFAERMNRADPPCHADLQLWIAGNEFALELDRDTMSPHELRRRIADYEHYAHDVLWVCPSRERVEQMKTLVREFQTHLWFTTLAELRANPRGYVWEDATGARSCLTT